MKLNIKNTLIIAFISGIILALTLSLNSYSSSLLTKNVREVTMIDTKAVTYEHKKNVQYNINGYFIDNLTGQKFYRPINDKVYRDFEASGNQPVTMQLELSQDNMNGNVTGDFWRTVCIMLYLANPFCVLIAMSCGLFVINTKDEEQTA